VNRTVCACPDCIEPCKRQPGYLIREDISAIAEYLKQQGRITTDEEVKQFLWASPGPLVGQASTGVMFHVPSITPKMARGRCVFLDDNDRCTIHPVSPAGCKFFDLHMSEAEGSRRSNYFIRQFGWDQEYQQFRDTLERKP
jgi:Fe-S-cluster containining protein